MRRSFLLISFVTVLSVLPSCNDRQAGPAVTVYISSPANGGMDFYDGEHEEGGFVNYSETDRFVCMKPADANRVIRYYISGNLAEEKKPEPKKETK